MMMRATKDNRILEYFCSGMEITPLLRSCNTHSSENTTLGQLSVWIGP